MKRVINLFIVLALLPFFTASMNSDNPVAIIKKAVNNVKQKSLETGQWVNSSKGGILYDGMEVKTGFKSLAVIQFTDNSGILTVRENCIANIYASQKNKKMNKNTVINKGVVHFDVNKQAPDEEFKFTTPTVVASIRGTSGYIEVEKDSTTNIICEKGLIEIEALKGNKEKGKVAAGNSVTIAGDGFIKSSNISSEQQSKLKKSKQVEIKTLKIKTKEGVLEIKYLPEEQ